MIPKEPNPPAIGGWIDNADLHLFRSPIKAAQQRQRFAPQNNGGNPAFRAIRNQGEIVERKPLTPWETYAQALMLSNEASYVN